MSAGLARTSSHTLGADARAVASLGPHAVGDSLYHREEDPSRCAAPMATRSDHEINRSRQARRHPWADLLQRVFEVDALSCPCCGGRMRILAAIAEADVARRILACLALPARAPPVAPRRPIVFAEPQANGDDALGREDPAWSGFEFDQTVPTESEAGT